MKFLAIFCSLWSGALAQNAGTLTQEYHPPFAYSTCTNDLGCSLGQGEITIDSNWRWTHQTGQPKNCYTGNTWDKTLCPDVATCTQNCAIEGVDQNTWTGTYGVHPIDGGAQLNFVTQGPYSKNIGSRVYLMEDSSNYKMFMLMGKEFSFDVDVSQLGCGLNGALYFVEMDKDGGMGKYPSNKAGAKYGTGYCDAQCPHDMKWINGEANVKDWKPAPTDPNSGTGHYGTCCTEMDIWESNKYDTAYTPHSCDCKGQTRCEGVQCGDIEGDHRYNGTCDKDGCDLNAYRSGVKGFFGPGSNYTLDTTQPMRVTTQFISTDGTANGDLKEIRRVYTQNGKTFTQAKTNIPKMAKQYDSISDESCTAMKDAFGDMHDFEKHGGLKSMGESLKRGMVLVMSLWDDHYAFMLWLDSAYPLTKPVTQPGILRGPCPTSSGKPPDVESKQANAHVKYYNVAVGEIGSTF